MNLYLMDSFKLLIFISKSWT